MDAKQVLDSVLPEYQRISQAPKSIFDLPEFGAYVEKARREKWPASQRAKEIDRLDDLLMQRETGKLYKSIDAVGNIFLIVNPITWKTRQDSVGRWWRSRPEPKLAMAAADVQRAINGQRRSKREQSVEALPWE